MATKGVASRDFLASLFDHLGDGDRISGLHVDHPSTEVRVSQDGRCVEVRQDRCRLHDLCGPFIGFRELSDRRGLLSPVTTPAWPRPSPDHPITHPINLTGRDGTVSDGLGPLYPVPESVGIGWFRKGPGGTALGGLEVPLLILSATGQLLGFYLVSTLESNQHSI